MQRTTRRAVAGLALAGTLVLAACGGGGDDSAETTAASTTDETSTTVERSTTTTEAERTTTTSEAPDGPIAPLTGLPLADALTGLRPALAVKFDNHPDAQPHAGLNQADVVYEEIVEGITRFFAIFHSTDAAPIGPVRSARTTDVDLLNQLNRPLFAWSGGNAGVVRAIGGANAESRAPGQAPGYFRDQERRRRADLEHTLFNEGTLTLYSTVAEGQGPPPAMFTFLEDGATAQGEPAPRVSLRMNSVPIVWTWNADEGRWYRDEYNDPHMDTTGAQISAENVIVQFCDYRRSPADPKSPEAVTVGSGDAWLFTGGVVVRGTWQRPDASQPAAFVAADGSPMLLTPGRTWIELAEAGDTEVTVG